MVSLVRAESTGIEPLKGYLSKLLSALYIPEDFLRGEKVLLKPNLVVPAAGDSPVITNPNLVIAAAQIFIDSGAREVVIAEGSLISADTAQAFKKSGLKKMADGIGVRCVDMKREEMITVGIDGAEVLHEIEIPKMLSEYKIVNLPKLKTHIQVKLSCAVKNMKGVLSDATKRRVHFLGLNRAIVDFSMLIKPEISIVDAITAMEGMGAISGTPVSMNLIFGGVNPFCVDTAACELIGYGTRDVEYLNIARDAGMAPSGIDDLVLTGDDIAGFKRDFVKPRGSLPEVSIISFEDADACSACIHTLSSFINTRSAEIAQIEKILKRRGEKIRIFLGPNIKEADLENAQKPVFFGKCTKETCDAFEGESAFVPGCPPAMSEDLFSKLIPLYEIEQKSLKGTFFDKIKGRLKNLRSDGT